MSALQHAVADQLLLIERELRALCWWSEVPPEAWRLQSGTPFCVDTLRLEEWLQWIFLPRRKALLEQGARLPGNCAILPIAELSWRERSQAGLAPLIAALGEMDRLLGGQA